MKSLILFSLFVLFLVSVQFAGAQTIDEIIDKYMDARGGKTKLLAIKTIYMEGSREMMGNEVPVKVIKEQGKLSRTEFEMGSSNGFMLVTEKEAWNYFPMRMEAPKKMPDEAIAAMQVDLDIAGPLVDYAAKGHKAELQGKETINDVNCFKIKLTTNAGKDITYWIDASSYMLVQSTAAGSFLGGRRRGPDEKPADAKTPPPGRTLIIYKDYQPVEGILFAHSIETKTEGDTGRPGGGTTFDKIELNKPVDAKLYKPE